MTESRLERATERLFGAIDARRDELVALVADLARRPSVLGHEALAQAYVAEYLRVSGLATESWDLDDSIVALPNAGLSGVPFADRPNVAGLLAGSGAGNSLILNGHVDVVSPEPIAAWTHDPWAADIVGDRMYGRGVYDMKCGLAINLFLPRLVRELGIYLGGDLIVHSVIEEECTGNGALAASRGQRADAAIVTESECGWFTNAHVGVLWFKVSIQGKAWHAMEARNGVNAIVKAVPIIQALGELDARMNATVHPVWEGVEHPINLNIGAIRGGDWPSTVAGACELHCRLSFFPGLTVEEVRREIEAAVRVAGEGDEWLRAHPPVVTYDGFQSAGSIVSVDEPSVKLLGQWHQRVTGDVLRFRSGTSINDMRYYNFVDVPAGCYGASGGNPHAADEWLDLNSLVPTAKVLGGFLLEWCGVTG